MPPPLPPGFQVTSDAPPVGALPPGFVLERPPPTSRLAAGFYGGAQVLTGGFSDELGAGLAAAVKSPFSEQSFGEVYQDQLGEERALMSAAREQYPWLFGGAEVAGSVLPISRAVQAGKMLPAAARNLPTWVRAAGAGAAAGAVYGAGTSEDNRLGDAATGAITGGIAGPVASTVAKPLLTAGRNIGQAAGRALTSTPRREAEQLVADALRRDLVNPQTGQTLARMAGDGPMVLADVGENLTGLARGSAAKPGPFRAEAHRVFPERQSGQQARLVRGLGVSGPQPYKDSFDDWAASKITQARPLYEQAYGSALDISAPQIQGLMSRPAMQRALRRAETKLKNEGGGGGHVALFDAAKRALDDDIGVAMRAGRRDEARILQNIKTELVSEMDRQVPVYAQARAVFAGEAALREAADFGTDLFKRNVSHDEARRLVTDMTPSEVEAFRRGALRGLVEQLETTAENRNVAARLSESVAMRDKLRLLFPNGGDFEKFVQQAADEARMTYTRNLVLGGSPTARIQEETRDLIEAGEILTDAMSGNKLGAFARLLRGFGVGQVSQETLTELGELLLKRQPQHVVDRLQRMASHPAPGSAPVSAATQLTAAGMAGAGLGASDAINEAELNRLGLIRALGVAE